MKHHKLISIVIPAYNEAQYIESNVAEAIETLMGFEYDFEVIVVDDGSRDSTYLAAARLTAKYHHVVRVVRYERNQDKGNALICGASFASGDIIAFLDADMDLHPRQLPTLFGIMEATGADVVIVEPAPMVAPAPTRRGQTKTRA